VVQLQIHLLTFSKASYPEFICSEFGEGRPSGHGSSGIDSAASRFDMSSSASAVGGLSVTGCLADFSVYIFHPYGGGKKTGKWPYTAQFQGLMENQMMYESSVSLQLHDQVKRWDTVTNYISYSVFIPIEFS